MLYLTKHLPSWTLLPLAPSDLPLDKHFQFGEALYHILQGEDARIALIASADLCHHGKPGDRNQISPETQAYDDHLREAVKTKNIDLLIQDSLAAERRPCGERPVAMALGALKELNTTTEELCYELPFGVGYLTSIFHIA